MNRIFHEIGHSYVHQTTAYSNNHQSWKKKRENMKKKTWKTKHISKIKKNKQDEIGKREKERQKTSK